jgi:hypothetical protein
MSVWRIGVEPWNAMVLRVETAVDEPAKRDVWAYWEGGAMRVLRPAGVHV